MTAEVPAVVAEAVAVAVGVAAEETAVDVVDKIAMAVDLISLQKQPTIVGITQNLMKRGTTTPIISLIAIKANESRRLIPKIVLNVRGDVVADAVEDAIETKDNVKTKRSPTVSAMTSGITLMGEVTTTDVMTVRAMMLIVLAGANAPVEDAVVVHAERVMRVTIVRHAMIAHHVMPALRATHVQLVEKETIAVGDREEAIALNVENVRNDQDVVVAVAAVHAALKRAIRFLPFHDTAKCRLGTTQSLA